MRVIILTSLAAMLISMSSCSKDDTGVVKSIDQWVEQQPVAVTFSTYKADAPTTRAGDYGVISTDASLQAKGFGVFAYYTQETKFDNVPLTGAGSRSLVPDFMYNEYIVWDGTNNVWKYYDPDDTKYWPNDFAGNGNDVDNRNATGSKLNYISFFAYAPYAGTLTQNSATTRAGATPPTSNGDGLNSGVIAASGNNFNGDPFLTYRLSNNSQNTVDLMWGTAGGTGNGKNVVGTAQGGNYVTRSVDNGTENKPIASVEPTNIDMTKQETDGKVKFNFKHALAKIGGSTTGTAANGLTVDLLLDTDGQPGSPATAAKSANTIVTIKSIRITHDDATTGTPAVLTNPMPSTGVFNLATGQWIVTAADASDPSTYVTLDYLIDQTGSEGNQINAMFREPTTAVAAWTDLTMAGVDEVYAYNVFATEAYPLVLIPGTTPHLKFTIEYCVRTQDTKLAKGFTEVWQKITKTVAFTAPVESNKQYNIAMHLGLTSVKFDASVCDWDNGTTTKVDLPINVN